ncbi:MAG TPA: M36 family metallopeptidase, partial [Pyrinomonadaceae bacterium]|nr:M36 family metallopeptidase [Pyrinomonadaceae bacterium]
MKKAFPFFILFVLAAAVFLFRQSAAPVAVYSAARIEQSTDLSNYDIRTANSEAARAALINFRRQSGRDSSLLPEQERRKMNAAEAELRRRVPALKIEYGERLQTPEIISPDAARRNDEWLSAPSQAGRAFVLRAFVKDNSALFGLDGQQADALKTTADYAHGNLSFAQLEQEIKGLRVFQGEIKAAFTSQGEIVRVVNNLAPSLDYRNLSTEAALSAERAVGEAAKSIGVRISENETRRTESAAAGDKKIRFERGQFADATTVEKIYFPVEAGVARLAWQVLFWRDSEAYYVIVDARDATLLWRKNITEHQTQAATYNVYGNQASMMKTADSPTAFTPGCATPNPCPEPPVINRQSFTLVGNEPPYAFNNLGWIPDGENRTVGNNAEAGIDRQSPNGIDDNGWAFGSPNRNFVYNYNPAPGNPPPGEEPLPPAQTYPPSPFQQGSTTNAFYVVNRYHDELYRLGFTEPARNFQTDNFGRGGAGNDSVSVEVQDASGTNNANFTTPMDGGRGRLQLYVWTNPTPDRDGALDNQMIVHELTHGLSNRLHGNVSGLDGNMARGMGEGW